MRTAGWLFRRALAIRESALDAHHPDIASSLDHGLLSLLFDIGELSEAEFLLHRALAIAEPATVAGTEPGKDTLRSGACI